jgi:hypothetical protein
MKTAKIHSPFDCQNYGFRKGGYRRLTRQAHREEISFPTSLANRWKKLRSEAKMHGQGGH